MKKIGMLCVISLVLVSALWANGSTEATPAAYPSEAIEFVIPGSAGGGSDILARQILEVIQKNKLTSQVITAVNKGGGGGTVGMAYLNSKSNADYSIITTNSANMLTMHIASCQSPKGPYVPLACMAMDNQLLVVRSDSPYQNIDAIIAYLKKNPKGLTVGFADDLDNMALTIFERAAGVTFNRTAYFGSSGDNATALLGGHIDVSVLNPVECIGLVEAGRLKAIGAFTPERIAKPFDNVPTFKESGFPDAVLQMYRGVLGAAGMSREAQLYWSNVLKSVSSNPSWQANYIEKNVLGSTFLDCDAFASFIAEQEKTVLGLAKEMDLLK